jgi:hypothetical protein
MALRPHHEIHTRRFGRNLGVGLTLGAFIVIVFAMTVVKVTQGGDTQAPAAQTAVEPTKETTP